MHLLVLSFSPKQIQLQLRVNLYVYQLQPYFKVVFHVCCPYLRAMSGLGPGVRSMTELGAALLVLSRGEGDYLNGFYVQPDVTVTSTKLEVQLPERKGTHCV